MDRTTKQVQRTPLHRNFRYWFLGIVRPKLVLSEIENEPRKILTAFWMNFFFSILYAITPIVTYLTGGSISFDPWMPIPSDVYYLYQPLWTIPWGLATWIMLAGIAHICALIGKNDEDLDNTKPKFDDALLIYAIGWVIPWFVCGFLPETFILPWGIRFPDWLEVMRYSVFPVLWQTILFTIGLMKSHKIKWFHSLLIALVNDGVFFIMFLAFLR